MLVAEQLDLLSRPYPSLRPRKKLTMVRLTPRSAKTKESPPARFSVRDENGTEVATIWDPGPGFVQWYTEVGGGQSSSPTAAFTAIKELLGAQD